MTRLFPFLLGGQRRSEEPETAQSITSSLTLTKDDESGNSLRSNNPLRGESLIPKLEDPWARKNVLCLDGGGIRGYASLLVIRNLMERIAKLEKIEGDGHLAHTNSAVYDRCISLPGDGKYRPHHYFDYFVGTSTGGLSAIMLGRLQMTVDDALTLYDTIGNRVFAHPRFRFLPRCLKGYAKMIREKYSAEELEEALRDAIEEHLQAEIERTNVSSRSEVPLRNENPDAAQTIVVTWGGSQTRDACLFRSFDHPPPAPNLPAKERYGHLKPYSASPAPIWAAARATSAAPTYFKRIKIGDGEFWDGAVGAGCNNPVRLAYDEVRQMHRNDLPATILSLGTGLSPKKSQEMSKHSIVEKAQLAKQSLRNSSDSENSYIQFEQYILEVNKNLTEDEKIKCVRLNPDGLSSVKLDTWLPLRSENGKAGADTKLLMKKAVEAYLKRPEVSKSLQSMAESLVERRRRRAAAEDCGRWERFALHLYYGCPEKTCSTDSLFKTRDELREHAFYRHGIVRQIDTRHCARWHDQAYACYSDGCGQKFVPVFANEIDFTDHLRRYHKLEDPQIMSQDDYENWLDDGRDRGASRSRRNLKETIGQQNQGVG